jgi:hypothetical protein
MKIHCGQLVEGALKNALDSDTESAAPETPTSDTLAGNINDKPKGTIRIVPLED